MFNPYNNLKSVAVPQQTGGISTSSVGAGPDYVLKRSGDPVVGGLKIPGSKEAMISPNGDFNAWDRKDLARRHMQMFQSMNNGELAIDDGMSSLSASEQAYQRAAINHQFREAFNNPDIGQWASLGSALAAKIEAQMTREGFMGTLMRPYVATEGEWPRIRTHERHVTAVVSSGINNIGYQHFREKESHIREIEIKASVRVAMLDLDRQGQDLLNDARDECYEQISVQEDRQWKLLADASVYAGNKITYLAGELTPNLFAQGRLLLEGKLVPPAVAIMAYDLWADFFNDKFLAVLDQVHRYDLFNTGYFGSFQGIKLITDGYRLPNFRVLDEGEMYFVAQPDYHGAYVTRNNLIVMPNDGFQQNEASRGWFVRKTFGAAITNANSVSKLVRLR